MGDSLGIASDLDRLLPTERLRDSKAKRVRQEVPAKKREKKRDEGAPDDRPQPDEETSPETPAETESGKILNILI